MKGRKNFSSFDVREAFLKLQIDELLKWEINAPPLEPTAFFHERMRRLEHFDLTISERAKELLIDAVCEEVLTRHDKLKIWKSAMLQSDDLTGTVDYLVSKRRGYLSSPFACVVEAKKDDFEKGMAQCLVEMQACRWNNDREGVVGAVHGIVTNGGTWVFYRLSEDGKVFESLPYSFGNINTVLGALNFVFAECEKMLNRSGA